MTCGSPSPDRLATFFRRAWPYYAKSSPHPKMGGFLVGYGTYTLKSDVTLSSEEEALELLSKNFFDFYLQLGKSVYALSEEQILVLFSLYCYLWHSFFQHKLWSDVLMGTLTPSKLKGYLKAPELREDQRLYSPFWAKVRLAELELLEA